jgi:hypothetical protein
MQHSLEINNLAQNPRYKRVLEQLRKECDVQVKHYSEASLNKK